MHSKVSFYYFLDPQRMPSQLLKVKAGLIVKHLILHTVLVCLCGR